MVGTDFARITFVTERGPGSLGAAAPQGSKSLDSGFKDEEAVARMLGEADCPMIEENQLETVV